MEKTRVRLAVICVMLMLMPPLVSYSSDAGSTLTQGIAEFQNGTKVNLTSMPQGMRLAWNETYIGNWTRMSPWPTNRYWTDMVFDSGTGMFVLFGGVAYERTQSIMEKNDTWTYNLSTNTWTEKFPVYAPSRRYWHEMAYDSINRVIVLFGGCNSSGSLSDTWIYNTSTNTWTKKYPAYCPPATAPMVYDTVTGLILLIASDKTWTYNVSSNVWADMNLNPMPFSRQSYSIAYDSERGEVLLFGGGTTSNPPYLNDTWIYNVSKNSWTNMSPPNAPSGRHSSGLEYDTENRNFILFGGNDDQTYYMQTPLDDTWIYDRLTNTWTEKRPMTKPPIRFSHSTGFDNINNRMVLFGGRIAPNDPGACWDDTWIYDQNNGSWVKMNIAPIGRYGLSMVYDDANELAILFGGISYNYGYDWFWPNDTWTYTPSTNAWKEMNPKKTPSPWGFGEMVYDPKKKVAFLFGGCDETGRLLDESWTYDAGIDVWTELERTNAPTPRTSPAMVYDDKNNLIVLFGGGDAWGYCNDTWTYNSSTNSWTEMRPISAPSPRNGHSMAYDSINGVVILFGGFDTSGLLNDETWTYNLALNIWTNVSPLLSPSPRSSHEMAYDPLNGEVLLFGGSMETPDDSIWTYNVSLNKWTKRSPSLSIIPRYDFGIGLDSTNGSMIIYGGWQAVAQSGTYIYSLKRFLPTGNYTSPSLDTGGSTDFKDLEWNCAGSINTTIQFQFRTANTENTLNSTPFAGPDGTGKTFYNSSGQSLFSGHDGNRWFQYRAYLCTTNPCETPNLKNVTVKYNLLPKKAVLDMPFDGVWTNTSRPAFTWNFSDNDSPVGGFEWQLDNSKSFDSVEYKSGQVSSTYLNYSPDNPISDGPWYWRIRTQDSDGDWGPFCDGRLIHIDSSPPEPFQPTASPLSWTNGAIQLTYVFSFPTLISCV